MEVEDLSEKAEWMNVFNINLTRIKRGHGLTREFVRREIVPTPSKVGTSHYTSTTGNYPSYSN